LLLHGTPAGLCAVLVTGPAFRAVAGLADRPHDTFLHCAVAGVPALFHHIIVNEPIARLTLILAC
jgi:hypothetical protein